MNGEKIVFSSENERFLTDGWTLVLTEAGQYAEPSALPAGLDAVAAFVPGTVAQALEAAGRFDRTDPYPLNVFDAWYRLSLKEAVAGEALLRFAGLATIAEVYLNNDLILSSESMFEVREVPVHLTGHDELAICFRALAPHLERRGPRARWRPQLMKAQGLRLIRTTALGYMPGWCPEIHAAGPWRPVSLIRPKENVISDVALVSELTETNSGILRASLSCADFGGDLRLSCAGEEAVFVRQDDGRLAAELCLSDIRPWWPHTHGSPCLYEVFLCCGDEKYSLGRAGFRRIAASNGADGGDFALAVNGERIFCRGAVWTSADIVRLPGASKDYEAWLRLAVEAGMNMIRVGGTMAYETPEFFRLCDELGLMVWQDLMFANFDYPVQDGDLVSHIGNEVTQFLQGIRHSPSLSVLCGGSEMYQQAAMLGLPERIWKGSLTEEILPELCRRDRPDVPYVPNSPYGGALPFFPNAGVAHYYGVGAYCCPLEDARRANVRFAAECLAFAHVPQQETLEMHPSLLDLHSRHWKSRVPRDRGAEWDFEDVRDHYLARLYAVDPAGLRHDDPVRYLQLSRAVTAEVVEETFAEWRRPGSMCNGALVWTLQDLLPGAGWGVIDADGRPKPVWYALKRAFRSVQVVLTDEGTNGLDIHVINETERFSHLLLDVTCLRDGRNRVVSGHRELMLKPREKRTLVATDLFGAFFDTTYAYRFGPPSHDVTIAKLRDRESGVILAEAFHFPLGRATAQHDCEIETAIVRESGGWFVDLASDCFVQSVHVSAKGYRPADDWFHMSPGEAKRLELLPDPGAAKDGTPSGTVGHIGSARVTVF